MTDQQLLEKAFEAMEFAYVPYSGCKVGAALLGDDGRVYTGCNFENVSFGATICAERCAVGKAISEGCRRFEKLAVVNSTGGIFTPCGMCRQVLLEFAPQLPILCSCVGGKVQKYNLQELLPAGFSSLKGEE